MEYGECTLTMHLHKQKDTLNTSCICEMHSKPTVRERVLFLHVIWHIIYYYNMVTMSNLHGVMLQGLGFHFNNYECLYKALAGQEDN